MLLKGLQSLRALQESLHKRVLSLRYRCQMLGAWIGIFDALKTFVKDHVSILFSNEDEISSLGKSDVDRSAAQVSGWVDELVVTKGAERSQHLLTQMSRSTYRQCHVARLLIPLGQATYLPPDTFLVV